MMNFFGKTITKADYVGKIFFNEVNFSKARFNCKADFRDSVFEKFVNFENCYFNAEVDFTGALFKQGASFENAIFLTHGSNISFQNATFKPFKSENWSIPEISFQNAKFGLPVQQQFGEWDLLFEKSGDNYKLLKRKTENSDQYKSLFIIDEQGINENLCKQYGLTSFYQSLSTAFNQFRLNPHNIDFKNCWFGTVDIEKIPKEKINSILNKTEKGLNESDQIDVNEPLSKKRISKILHQLTIEEINNLFSENNLNITFRGTSFNNQKNLDFNTVFINQGHVDFSEAQFANQSVVSFNETYFFNQGHVSFRKTQFFNQGCIFFSHAQFKNSGYVTFRKSQLANEGFVSFRNAGFANNNYVSFREVQFTNHGYVSFRQTQFKNSCYTSFLDSQFINLGNADFSESLFMNQGYVYFSESLFANIGHVSFQKAQFTDQGYVSFLDAKFTNQGHVTFQKAIFTNQGSISFRQAQFINYGHASFHKVKFYNKGYLSFRRALFKNLGNLSFRQSQFRALGYISFRQAQLINQGEVLFRKAQFSNQGEIDFNETQFMNQGEVDFFNTQFTSQSVVNFSGTRFANDNQVNFDETEFINQGCIAFNGAQFTNLGCVSFCEVKFANQGYIYYFETLFMNYGGVYFRNALFINEDDISFGSAYFINSESVDFTSARFGKKSNISFNDCLFLNNKNVLFNDVHFPEKGSVLFQQCYFTDPSKNQENTKEISFIGTVFMHALFEGGENRTLQDDKSLNEILAKKKLALPHWIEDIKIPKYNEIFSPEVKVTWKKITTDSAKNITFRLVNFSRSVFDGMFLKYVELNAAKWLKKKNRNVLYIEDENRHNIKSKYLFGTLFKLFRLNRFRNKANSSNNVNKMLQDIENQYTQLKINLEKQGDYAHAGDFHYGEMEARRLAMPWYRRWFTITNIYRLSTGYGERPVRSFIVLVLLIVSVSFASLIVANEQWIQTDILKHTKSAFQIVPILKSIWLTLTLNMNDMNAEMTNNQIIYYTFLYTAKILIYLQVVMFGLAVKRRYKR